MLVHQRVMQSAGLVTLYIYIYWLLNACISYIGVRLLDGISRPPSYHHLLVLAVVAIAIRQGGGDPGGWNLC